MVLRKCMKKQKKKDELNYSKPLSYAISCKLFRQVFEKVIFHVFFAEKLHINLSKRFIFILKIFIHFIKEWGKRLTGTLVRLQK